MKTIETTKTGLIATILNRTTKGLFFSVTFRKKNGELRVMNCRRGVQKHSSGGTLKYDPTIKGLLSVYDVKSGGYRMINLETVTEATIGGTKFKLL